MVDVAQRRYSLDDYMAIELASPVRHEFIGGAVFAMAGGTPRHNEIAANLLYAMRRALEHTPCRPMGADQRIRVSDIEYTYADVSVYCGAIEVGASPPPDTATNPVVLVEVLSDSTRAYDHGDKLAMYQQMPSLRSIWLVEPDTTRITVWQREAGEWASRAYGIEDRELPLLDVGVSLADIYATTLT